MTGYTCPVCDYDSLTDPPTDFSICPSCGTEFDNDDYDKTHAELRAEWIQGGRKWWSSYTKRPNKMKDELREAARVAGIQALLIQCQHEWGVSYLIPRCVHCGHTEASAATYNIGVQIGFDAGYEAGKRAERDRIIEELDRISDTSDGFDIHSMRIETFIDELRAEPYTEGE